MGQLSAGPTVISGWSHSDFRQNGNLNHCCAHSLKSLRRVGAVPAGRIADPLCFLPLVFQHLGCCRSVNWELTFGAVQAFLHFKWLCKSNTEVLLTVF